MSESPEVTGGGGFGDMCEVVGQRSPGFFPAAAPHSSAFDEIALAHEITHSSSSTTVTGTPWAVRSTTTPHSGTRPRTLRSTPSSGGVPYDAAGPQRRRYHVSGAGTPASSLIVQARQPTIASAASGAVTDRMTQCQRCAVRSIIRVG